MTRALLLALLIAGGAVLLTAQAPDRSRPPQPGAPAPLRLSAIQKSRLSNGLPVWIVERHKVPVAEVALVVFTGSSADPAGQFGVASLTAAMLDEGAGSRSSLDIADAVDFLGAELDTGSGVDAMSVRLHVPVARLADALPIVADVALRPTFPAADLERVRRERLTSILQSRDDPATIGALAFSRALFGTAHRYGTATLGTSATVAALTADDLRAFYRAAFQPRNAVLLVVGDVTPDTALPLLESNFGSWRDGPTAPPAAVLPAASQPARRAVYLVDKPDAGQSQIRIGWVGVPRSTPDYFAIEVMNTILGGPFSSRLNTNLREQHGYAYGASSVFDMRVTAGPFVAAAAVQTDKTAEAVREFFVELDRIREPVPGEELDRAKHYMALRYPAGFEAAGDVSRRLEEVMIHHLPDDYFSTYIERIGAVSAEDVLRVARTYLDPSRFVVVVTGDRKAIEPGLRALGLGPVTILTIEEVFGPLR